MKLFCGKKQNFQSWDYSPHVLDYQTSNEHGGGGVLLDLQVQSIAILYLYGFCFCCYILFIILRFWLIKWFSLWQLLLGNIQQLLFTWGPL
jgi:hypothetical protein